MNKDLLLNPFSRIAGGRALAWGLVAIVAGIALGYALDVHCWIFNAWWMRDMPWWLIGVERLQFWLLPSLLLWLAGMWLSRSRVRAVDVFGTMAFAQWPVVLLTVVGWPQAEVTKQIMRTMDRYEMPTGLGIAHAISSVLIILLFAWWLVWMFQAFRVSCNLRRWKLWGTFLVVMGICYLSRMGLMWLATLN